MPAAASASVPEPSKAKKPLGAIFLTVFLDLVGFSLIFPLFPALLAWYLGNEPEGGAFAQFLDLLQGLSGESGTNGFFLTTVLFGGILGSLYSLLQFLFAPVWGRLSDRIGRRKVFLITLSGNLAGYLIWLVSGSFLLFVLARVVNGVMSGNVSVASAAMADCTSRENRSKGMALIGMAFGLGFVLGPAIGAATMTFDLSGGSAPEGLFGLHPFSGAALVAAVLAGLNLLWVATRLPETLPADETTAQRHSPRILSPRQVEEKPVRRLLWVNLFFLIAFSGMEFTLTFLATERLGYAPAEMWRLFVFIGFVMLFTQGLLVRRYAAKVGERNFALGAFLCAAGALLCLAFAQGPGLFYAGLLFLGLGAGIVNPCLSALVSLFSSECTQGRALGAFRSAGALARVIGPIAAAVVFWRFSSQAAYLFGALLVVLPFLLGLGVRQPRHDEHA